MRGILKGNHDDFVQGAISDAAAGRQCRTQEMMPDPCLTPTHEIAVFGNYGKKAPMGFSNGAFEFSRIWVRALEGKSNRHATATVWEVVFGGVGVVVAFNDIDSATIFPAVVASVCIHIDDALHRAIPFDDVNCARAASTRPSIVSVGFAIIMGTVLIGGSVVDPVTLAVPIHVIVSPIPIHEDNHVFIFLLVLLFVVIGKSRGDAESGE